jgi:ABC-type transport system involved in cytochrome bd biosynthesis fused ATPase/permease subunit
LLYDGQPVDSFDLMALREHIGDSLNHQQIFEGTLRENIAMGRPKAPKERVEWAVEAIGLQDLVRSSRRGLDMVMYPQGQKLPRSLVQKIMIARAIVDGPRLLLLERSFDFLDRKERERIIEFLFSKEREWTVIAASNDQNVLESADHVSILRAGTVMKTGEYAALKSEIEALEDA